MINTKTIRKHIKSDKNDYDELIKEKIELEVLLEQGEEQTLYLDEQIERLKLEKSEARRHFERERELRNTNKRKLEKINNSRSWKLSIPIRKLGKLLKKTTAKKNTTYINVEKKELPKQYNSAVELEKKLWGGYSIYAFEDLNKLKSSPDASITERLRAIRSLARWYYDKGDFDKAYKELEYMNEINPLSSPGASRVVTEIKVLKKIGDVEIAKRKVWGAINAKGLQPELCLSMAHLAKTGTERLIWYNLLYDKYGYQQIQKKDSTKSLSLENIYTRRTETERILDKFKVSVIIPAYNAGDLIHIALDSLLNQTIQNLEIIVVDDCSLDNTVDVVSKYVEKDDRIKLIEKKNNEGAYAARNTALEYVTGDFITIHDSDDWSHSQKIEVQLEELIKRPECVGTISSLVRTSMDITPSNSGSLLSMHFLTINSSSLLVRKEVMEKLGGWDSVRVAGDSEFIFRIEKFFGNNSIHHINTSVPFSISLLAENSLTGTSMTHVKTIRFGLRRSYREAAQWWHRRSDPADLYLDPKSINRYFPCPVPNRVLKSSDRSYDYILIADYSIESNQEQLVNMLEYVAKKPVRIGIFHWPDYNANPFNYIADGIHELINMNEIDIIVPNEEIEAHTSLILTPRILNHKLDSVPNIKCNRTLIISDKDMSSKSKLKKEENLVQTLGMESEWSTIEKFKDSYIS